MGDISRRLTLNRNVSNQYISCSESNVLLVLHTGSEAKSSAGDINETSDGIVCNIIKI